MSRSDLLIQLRDTRLRLIETDRRLNELLQSHSWEVTAPARRFAVRFPHGARHVLRLVRLPVWFCTGQLRARVRARLISARSAPLPPMPPTPATFLPASLPPPLPKASGGTILVVDEGIPRHDRSAGERTTHDVLTTLLGMGWAVVLAPFDGRDAGQYSTRLAALGVLIIDDRVQGGVRAWLTCHGAKLDHVMLMHPEPADGLLAEVLRTTAARLSYYGHDLHFARLRMRGRVEGNIELQDISDRYLAMERRVWQAVDIVLYPSAEEVATVQGLLPGVEARAMPMLAYDHVPDPHPPPREPRLLFVGSFNHSPNVDGIRWFVREALPLLRAKQSEVTLTIVGGGAPPEVRALAGGGVTVAGWVSDTELAGLYAAARVAVVPLRYGAGVKGKVVEAMRLGVPVVTTPIGAEGLEGADALAV
ncbi:MAG: glycosyltransferase, partial [Acetobacteraceae bacterium]